MPIWIGTKAFWALSSFFLDHFSNYNTLCGFKSFHTRGFFVFFLVWVYFLAIFFSIFLPQNATNNEQRIFQGGNAVMTKTTWPLVFRGMIFFYIMEGSTIVHRITSSQRVVGRFFSNSSYLVIFHNKNFVNKINFKKCHVCTFCSGLIELIFNKN